MFPTYPARPFNGGYLNPIIVESFAGEWIWRPKVDGDRVLVEVDEKRAINRHGQPYTKGRNIPWEGLKAFYDTISGDQFHAIYPRKERWLDIEYCNKHKTHKGNAVILDVPMRRCPFLEFVQRVDDAYKLGSRGGFTSLHPWSTHVIGISVYREQIAQQRVMVLPWWGDGVASASTPSTTMQNWEILKAMAKKEMKRTGETTPFYEGLVAVRANSQYPYQLVSPTQKTGDWAKYRFSK